MIESKDLTRNRYNEAAEVWLSHSGGRDRKNFWHSEMTEFWYHLPLGGKVVEVGCGPATDGLYLKANLLNPVSVDYSRSMLSIAKEINPQAKLSEMDMEQLGFPDSIFDGFWATASLLHLEDPKQALNELKRITKNEGYGFISVKEGTGQGIDPKTGYFFRYYQGEEFAGILKELGYNIIQQGKREGTPSHAWLTYLVQVHK